MSLILLLREQGAFAIQNNGFELSSRISVISRAQWQNHGQKVQIELFDATSQQFKTGEFDPGINILTTADLDGDGKNELVIQDLAYRSTYIMDIDQATGELQVLQQLDAYDEYLNDTTIGDANNDGRLDFVALSNRFLYVSEVIDGKVDTERTHRLSIYSSQQVGNNSAFNTSPFTRPSRPLVFKEEDKRGVRVQLADIDGDGKNEILVVKAIGGFESFRFNELDIFRLIHSDFQGMMNRIAPGTGEEGIEVVDLDLDGKAEIVFSGYINIEFLQYDPVRHDLALKATIVDLAPWIADQRITILRTSKGFFLVHCAAGERKSNSGIDVGVIKVYPLARTMLSKLKEFHYFPPQEGDAKTQIELWRRMQLDQRLLVPLRTSMRLPVTETQDGKVVADLKKLLAGDVDRDGKHEIIANTGSGVFIFRVSE